MTEEEEKILLGYYAGIIVGETTRLYHCVLCRVLRPYKDFVRARPGHKLEMRSICNVCMNYYD